LPVSTRLKAEKRPASGMLVRQKNCRLRKLCPQSAHGKRNSAKQSDFQFSFAFLKNS
jgi:hypothetical protein